MYVDEVFYRTNVRRGNTLVEIVDSKGKKKIMWGRKGTQKILDIKLEYIESVTRNLQLNKDEKKSYDAIFQSTFIVKQRHQPITRDRKTNRTPENRKGKRLKRPSLLLLRTRQLDNLLKERQYDGFIS